MSQNEYEHSRIRQIIIDEIAKKDFPITCPMENDSWVVCFSINECYWVRDATSSRFALADLEMSFCAKILEYGKKPNEFGEWEEPEATSALYLANQCRKK